MMLFFIRIQRGGGGEGPHRQQLVVEVVGISGSKWVGGRGSSGTRSLAAPRANELVHGAAVQPRLHRRGRAGGGAGVAEVGESPPVPLVVAVVL